MTLPASLHRSVFARRPQTDATRGRTTREPGSVHRPQDRRPRGDPARDELHRLRRGLPGAGKPARRRHRRPPTAAGDAERDQPRVRLRQAVPRAVLGLADRGAARRLRPLDRVPAAGVAADRAPDRDDRVPGRLRGRADPARGRGARRLLGAAQGPHRHGHPGRDGRRHVDAVVRRRDRPDLDLHPPARVAARARDRVGLQRRAEAHDDAGGGARALGGGVRRPAHAGGCERGAAPRARRHRPRPRHPGAAGHPPPRPAQRPHPDHHGRRPHDREPDRGHGGGGERVRPERPRLVPGRGGRPEGHPGRAGDLPHPGGGVHRREHDRRPPLCPDRPPDRDRRERAVTGVSIAPAARRLRFARLPQIGTVGVVSAVVILVLALVAIFAPVLTPHDPNAIDLLHPFAAPSSEHLLGTDDTGRDLLSRLIAGSRTSLVGPLVVVILEVALGVPLALVAAWRGGLVDGVVSRVLDVIFAFPGILLAILVIAFFGAGLKSAVIALAIAHMPYLARVTRGAAIRERRLAYVQALEVQGFSAVRICARHLVPNLIPLIVAQATVSFGY